MERYSPEVEESMRRFYVGLNEKDRRRAHSHFPGQATKSERWEFAIRFNKFQRPAL